VYCVTVALLSVDTLDLINVRGLTVWLAAPQQSPTLPFPHPFNVHTTTAVAAGRRRPLTP